ncbi:MAG: hypothetical protein WCI71_02520 [Bacteroidota bacterium]
MKNLLFVTIMICLGVSAHAQVSRYLEKGQSGIGLKAGGEKTHGMYGFSGQVGGSVKGIIDIEFSFTKDLYDQKSFGLLDNNASSTLYEGWINWWVLRKQIMKIIDVNLAVWGEYANSPYRNYRYADKDTTNYNSYQEGQFGFEASLNFRLTDTWWLQPAYSAYYCIGQEKLTEGSSPVSNNYSMVSSYIALGLAKRIKKSTLYIQVNQYFNSNSDSTNTYKLSIGYILGL